VQGGTTPQRQMQRRQPPTVHIAMLALLLAAVLLAFVLVVTGECSQRRPEGSGSIMRRLIRRWRQVRRIFISLPCRKRRNTHAGHFKRRWFQTLMTGTLCSLSRLKICCVMHCSLLTGQPSTHCRCGPTAATASRRNYGGAAAQRFCQCAEPYHRLVE